MTVAGWIFMTLSLSSVVALASYCYVRVLSGKAWSQRDDSDQDNGP